MLNNTRRHAILSKLASRERRPHAVSRAMERMGLDEQHARRLVLGAERRIRAGAPASASTGYLRLPSGHYAAFDRHGGRLVVKTVLSPGMRPRGQELRA